MGRLVILVSVMVFIGSVARAQEFLIIPEIGMPMERLAEITGSPIDKEKLRERYGGQVDILVYRTVISRFEFNVTVNSLNDRVASYLIWLDDDAANSTNPCRFAFFGAYRILDFALGGADHPPPVPGPMSLEFRTFATFTKPDGSQGQIIGSSSRSRTEERKQHCSVVASYGTREITAIKRRR